MNIPAHICADLTRQGPEKLWRDFSRSNRESAMDESFTIDEFCADEKISRSFFYKLDAQGLAPKTYNVGRIRRISREARRAWREAREAATVAA